MPFDPHTHTEVEFRHLQEELQAANLTIAALRRELLKLKQDYQFLQDSFPVSAKESWQ